MLTYRSNLRMRCQRLAKTFLNSAEKNCNWYKQSNNTKVICQRALKVRLVQSKLQLYNTCPNKTLHITVNLIKVLLKRTALKKERVGAMWSAKDLPQCALLFFFYGSSLLFFGKFIRKFTTRRICSLQIMHSAKNASWFEHDVSQESQREKKKKKKTRSYINAKEGMQ